MFLTKTNCGRREIKFFKIKQNFRLNMLKTFHIKNQTMEIFVVLKSAQNSKKI